MKGEILWRQASQAFAAGALAGILMTLLLWFCGIIGVAAALGVKVAPPLTLLFVYKQIVWGGIWGFALLLPVLRRSWVQRGLLLGLAATLALLLVVFPLRGVPGPLALGLGALAPAYLLAFHLIFGLIAAWWYAFTGAPQRVAAAAP